MAFDAMELWLKIPKNPLDHFPPIDYEIHATLYVNLVAWEDNPVLQRITVQ